MTVRASVSDVFELKLENGGAQEFRMEDASREGSVISGSWS